MFSKKNADQIEHLRKRVLYLENKESYKESKEFLDRQQSIDYLLVLTRIFLETAMNTDLEKDIRIESGKQIQKILEKLK